MKALNFKINNTKFILSFLDSFSKITILEACLNNGIYIPHFCYNKYLLIAGNCRICIVEIEKFIKPIISCLNLCIDNLNIYTNSFSIKKFRENILEFLLINHPLDCPICDQAGECDLQEQTLIYGLDKSRFFFIKKSNSDIYLNNYIKLILNRCILCLRCVRFLRETNINNQYSVLLGTIGRGYFSKIHLYNNLKINLYGSLNIIDICPVGALTLKFNQYVFRPWEIIAIKFFDIFDSFGGSIFLNFKNSNIVRILPCLDSFFFSDFISDITRLNLNVFNNFFKLLDITSIFDYTNNSSLKAKFLLNITNNPLISFNSIKVIFKNLISYLKNFYFSSLYLNFNNAYLLNKLFIFSLNKKFLIIININLKFYMYRFFFFLNELKNKYNNIIYFLNEDFNFFNKFNRFFFKHYLNFSNFLNKFYYFISIYLIKFLSFFKILLNFDDLFSYKLYNINYQKSSIINLINFTKIYLNSKIQKPIINFMTINYIKYDIQSIYNIFGINIKIPAQQLIIFNFNFSNYLINNTLNIFKKKFKIIKKKIKKKITKIIIVNFCKKPRIFYRKYNTMRVYIQIKFKYIKIIKKKIFIRNMIYYKWRNITLLDKIYKIVISKIEKRESKLTTHSIYKIYGIK